MEIEIGSIRITPLRLLLFTILIAVFFLWFGYWPGDLPRDAFFSARRAASSYFWCAALFVASTGVACFGEQEYGMFPPTSLRPAFIVLGAVVIIASVAWMHSLRSAYTPHAQQHATVFMRAVPAVRLFQRDRA